MLSKTWTQINLLQVIDNILSDPDTVRNLASNPELVSNLAGNPGMIFVTMEKVTFIKPIFSPLFQNSLRDSPLIRNWWTLWPATPMSLTGEAPLLKFNPIT